MDIYSSFLKKYKEFTPIQKLSIPIIESGSNALIIAPTGAGKTESAMLPILKLISAAKSRDGIKVLYITPLRALNRDMMLRLEKLCLENGISIGVRHGDTSQNDRNKQAKAPPEVLITTPETLQSILPTKYLGAALANVKYVIIDEIHELYYNKRGAQLSLALERLEEKCGGFKRIGLSATVGNAETISKFLCGNRECKIVSSNENHETNLKVEMPQAPKSESKEIMEKFGLDKPAFARLEQMAEEVSNSESTLIFANTRQIVEALGSRLLYINSKMPFGGIGVHHSSIEKEERIKMENDFKEGKIKGLMATSSLELGIDIGSVSKVIQYGSPRQALRLIQRVGRSGHSLKKKSYGKIIATNIIDALESCAVCINAKNHIIESYGCQFNALDVLANQVCGLALDKATIRFDDLLAIIKRSFVYASLGPENLKGLLEFLSKQRLIGFDGITINSGKRTRMYYYKHLSVIPDTRRLLVKNIANNKTISSLDEKFVASRLEEGSVFITKGLPWKIISIEEDYIYVEPSTDMEAALPDWSGEDIPVSIEVARKVSDLLARPEMVDSYDLIKSALSSQIAAFAGKCGEYSIAKHNSVTIEIHPEYVAIYTFLGTLGNEALSRILGYMLSMKLGKSVNIKSSPYLVFIETQNDIHVAEMLKSINPSDIEGILNKFLEGSEIFMYHFVTIAKLFDIIDKGSKISRPLTKRIISIFKDSPVYLETQRELMENYFDTKNLSEFIKLLKSGQIKLNILRTEKITEITRAIMDSAYYTKELIMPLTPSNELVNSFIEFTTSKNVKLICTYCGFYFSVKMPEFKSSGKITCPSCGSPMIAINKEGLREVILKRKESRPLSQPEKNMLKEALTEASLLSSYGWKAAVALSTYGIGPKTASRALMMLRREDRLFYIDLIEAQKQFIKTKKYWSM